MSLKDRHKDYKYWERGVQHGHLDFHTVPELWSELEPPSSMLLYRASTETGMRIRRVESLNKGRAAWSEPPVSRFGLAVRR